MSIPQKGSRTLDINGAKYRFLVKEKRYADKRALTLTIQRESDNLIIHQQEDYGIAITPDYVRSLIEEASSESWRKT